MTDTSQDGNSDAAKRAFDRAEDARQREREIRDDPMSAPLADLTWLAQRLEQSLRVDDPTVSEHKDLYEVIDLKNAAKYLDFIMRLLPARAAIEAARLQDRTNRALVEETKTLATWTIVVASTAIASLIAAVAFWTAALP